jgi:hypothetical protein
VFLKLPGKNTRNRVGGKDHAIPHELVSEAVTPKSFGFLIEVKFILHEEEDFRRQGSGTRNIGATEFS